MYAGRGPVANCRQLRASVDRWQHKTNTGETDTHPAASRMPIANAIGKGCSAANSYRNSFSKEFPLVRHVNQGCSFLTFICKAPVAIFVSSKQLLVCNAGTIRKVTISKLLVGLGRFQFQAYSTPYMYSVLCLIFILNLQF